MANPTVRIIIDGDAKKYIRALKHVEQDTDSFRSKIGAGLGKAAKTGGLIAGAAIAGVGAAAVSAAKEQDEANSIIQRATGRTGEALTALQEQSQDIFRSTNATQEAIAGTIGTVDTLFSGTAEQVGAMTLSLESFSDVVGGDMVQNASDLGKVANIFGEDIGGAHESLDALTAVSQGYDIEGGELLKVLQKQGKNFAALGLDIGSSAVAMGKLNAAGIDIRSMGSGVERFIGIAVEAGQDPADAFRQLEADIRNAASAEEALAVATDALGDKAGVQLANAIGQGVEIMGDFTGEVEASKGQLELMAAESETVGEKFQRMQNNITGALADVGAPILDALMPIIDIVTNDLMPAVEPALKTIADLFGQLAPAVGPIVKALADALVPIIDTLVQVLVPVLVPVLGLVGELMADLAPIVGMVVTSIGRLLIPIIEMLMPPLLEVVRVLMDALLPVLEELWPVIESLLVPVLEVLMAVLKPILDILSPLIKLLGDAVGAGLSWYIKTVVSPVIGFLSEKIGELAGWLGENLMPIIETVFGWLQDKLTPAWETLTDAIGWVIEKVQSAIGWFQDLWDKLKGMTWGEIWDNLKNSFRNAVNAIISAWNAIDFGFHFTVPDIWGVPNRGETFGIDDLFPDIPLLASGGIVTDPTLAMVGEAGPEAVIPLDRFRPQPASVTVNFTVRIDSLTAADDDLSTLAEKVEDAFRERVKIAGNHGILDALGVAV